MQPGPGTKVSGGDHAVVEAKEAAGSYVTARGHIPAGAGCGG